MTHLVDTTLLPCDFREGLSKHESMVKPQGGDSSSQRSRYNIRAVIFTANSNFQDRHIDLVILFEIEWFRQKTMLTLRERKA
jgi:hypothetical protein